MGGKFFLLGYQYQIEALVLLLAIGFAKLTIAGSFRYQAVCPRRGGNVYMKSTGVISSKI